eukprot:TRINITY_DN2846_c0_g1_i1.p1 TRINITY_DN2846_c0_g1~~TRINITY_DN2846_c0_g1_i1.p1  ORF type:complete len:1029 (+),score=282.27 TRINITY_DN2846_c0_g1_i1:137-3223(+)
MPRQAAWLAAALLCGATHPGAANQALQKNDGGKRSRDDDFTWWSAWTETTHMPMTVYDCHAIDSDGLFYVVGGRADGSDSDKLMYLDPTTMSWSEPKLLPLGVRGRSTVAIGDYLYIFTDAATAAEPSKNSTDLPRIARLNTTALAQVRNESTYEWDVVSYNHSAATNPTCGAAAVVFGHRIYLIGGVPAAQARDRPLLYTGIDDGAAFSSDCEPYLQPPNGTKPRPNATASVRTYDPATGVWGEDTPLPEPLFYPTAVVADQLYVIGGMRRDGQWSNRIFTKSIVRGSPWSELPPMPVDAEPGKNDAVEAPAAFAFDSSIWVLTHSYSASDVMVKGLLFDLYLHQWSWTYIDDAASKTARRRGCYATGTGPAKGNLFLFGGLDPDASHLASLVQASIYPYITNVKDSYKINAQIAITVSQESPRNPFTFRLSSTPECWDSALGSQDQLWSGDQNEVIFDASAPGTAYLCLSTGACQKTGVRVTCIDPGSAAPSMPSCVQLGCCYEENDGKRECFERVAQSESDRLSKLTPLNWGRPIRVHDSPAAPTPPPSLAPTDAPSVAPSDVTLSVMDMLWLGLGIVFFLLCCGGLYFYAIYKFGGSPRYNRSLDHLAGTHVERYSILHKLGSGGYGYVFLVSRKTDHRRMAMKYIGVSNDTERHDAVAEFELTKSLQGHPHIVHLLDMFMSWSNDSGGNVEDLGSGSKVGGVRAKPPSDLSLSDEALNIDRRYVCIVMEYYPAGDLKEFLLAYDFAHIPEATLWYITHQVCLALSFMHGRSPPVVHRDLKPENILIHSAEHVDPPNGSDRILLPTCVVTDLGLAKVFTADGYCQTQAGSLPYVAPECWQRRYGVGVDMWALGCILYGACTRRIDSNATKVMFSEVTKDSFKEDLQRDVHAVAGYSETLSDFILLLLEQDPHVRPSAQYCEEYSRKQLHSFGITNVKSEAAIEHEINERQQQQGGPAPRVPPIPVERERPAQQNNHSSSRGASHSPESLLRHGRDGMEDTYLLSNVPSHASYTPTSGSRAGRSA